MFELYIKYLRLLTTVMPVVIVVAIVAFSTIKINELGREKELKDITIRSLQSAQANLEKIDKLTKVIKATRVELNPIQRRKEEFLAISNVSFHYIDKSRLENYHNDYFKEPTVENLIREITTEVEGEFSTSLARVIEAKAGGKNLRKWISTIKLPDTSLNGKFLRWQRETIKNEQVSIGLELVEAELSGLRKFDELVEKLKDFRLNIQQSKIKKARTLLQEMAPEQTLLKLEKIRGWILVEGSFLITKNEGEKYYKAIFTHPVSAYFAASGVNYTISFLISEDEIEPHVAANYAQSVGSSVPLRVYGEVWQPVSRKDNRHELLLTPLAVY